MKDILPVVDSERPVIIAGPCSAETEEQTLSTARQLADAGITIFRAGIWKPRTKPGGFEGVGSVGLQWLRRVKEETGMLIATEVATRAHVTEALDNGVDILWIGARTSANPFAVQEIADTIAESGKDVAVLVKNPVNPDLELWVGALQRLYNAGVRRLGAIHRGFSEYGKHLYRNAPEWRIPIELRRRFPSMQILCDPSHIGGKRELVAPLSQQSLTIGFDGLIVECHCSPDDAWSDAAQQVTPATLALILDALVTPVQPQLSESLTAMRSRIDRIDNDLIELLASRMEVSREIGQYKLDHNMPVVQAARYDDIMNHRCRQAQEMAMSPDFMARVFAAIHEESVRQQVEILKNAKK